MTKIIPAFDVNQLCYSYYNTDVFYNFHITKFSLSVSSTLFCTRTHRCTKTFHNLIQLRIELLAINIESMTNTVNLIYLISQEVRRISEAIISNFLSGYVCISVNSYMNRKENEKK